MTAKRSRQPWMRWEDDFLLKWYGKMPRKKIAMHLGRTIPAVSQRAYNKGVLLKRLSTRNGYQLISAGISYKKALPKNKWPRIEHFLASFHGYAKLAEEKNSRLDVARFMKEYARGGI